MRTQKANKTTRHQCTNYKDIYILYTPTALSGSHLCTELTVLFSLARPKQWTMSISGSPMEKCFLLSHISAAVISIAIDVKASFFSCCVHYWWDKCVIYHQGLTQVWGKPYSDWAKTARNIKWKGVNLLTWLFNTFFYTLLIWTSTLLMFCLVGKP